MHNFLKVLFREWVESVTHLQKVPDRSKMHWRVRLGLSLSKIVFIQLSALTFVYRLEFRSSKIENFFISTSTILQGSTYHLYDALTDR